LSEMLIQPVVKLSRSVITLSKVPQSFSSSILPPEVVEHLIKKWSEHPMTIPRITKVVINIAVGGASDRLEKAVNLLENLTKQKPSIRRAKKTIKEFGISKGQPIAAIVTLRGFKAHEFLQKVFRAIGMRIPLSSFDEYGNVSFGIKEHITIPGVRYDPEIGIFGMDIAVTVERPGYRVARRRRCRKRRIPHRHKVTKEESILLLEMIYGVKVFK